MQSNRIKKIEIKPCTNYVRDLTYKQSPFFIYKILYTNPIQPINRTTSCIDNVNDDSVGDCCNCVFVRNIV